MVKPFFFSLSRYTHTCFCLGHDFVAVTPSDWTVSEIPILFTKESLLYAGGVTNACGFIGKMTEVF